MGLHVLNVKRWLRRISTAGWVSVLILAWFAPPAFADSVTVTEESDWYFTVDTDDTLVVIYGNSNQDCENLTVDPYLWLYLDDILIASDDDGNHVQGQCLSSKLYITLNAGDYRLRAGYYPQQNGLGYDGGQYELLTDFTLGGTPSTTTSTSTTTTTSSTTTTTSTTTTSTTTSTTLLPTTTSSSTTTVVPSSTSTTSTTPTTTTTIPSTTTTSTTSTTLPPTTTTTSTTVAPTTTTTVALTTTTSTSTTITTTTVAPTTTFLPPTTTSSTTTVAPTTSLTTTTVPTTVANTSLPPAPPNDAPQEIKEQFENTVNVYSGAYDEYVPVGSSITVAQRRTIVAVTTVTTMLPLPGGKRASRSSTK